MRTLSAALIAAHAAAVQRPAWLVEIGWSATARLCSYGTTSAFGFSWQAADVDVSRVRVDGPVVGGTLVLGNADDTFGALALSEGVSDRRIRIWGFDAAATADADFVLLADCAGGAAAVTPERVSITLRDSAAFQVALRTAVNAAAGFTHLLPAGRTITLNGQSFRIGR